MTQANTPHGAALALSLTPLRAALCADGRGTLDVLLRVQAPQQAVAPRIPLALALVIDRSGSMGGDKIQAALRCTEDLVRQLHPDEQVCLVSYDNHIVVELPLMPATAARATLHEVLGRIGARGGTNLHAGWLAGAEQLAARTGDDRVCRVILLSDGQANQGITDEATICEQVRQLAQAGVGTTTVGLGSDFNERLMTAMAVAGQGSALYGDRAEDLAEPFESELGLLASLAWREVTVTLGSATSRWRLLNDYAATDEHTWSLPAIAAGAEAWACFSVPMDRALSAQRRSRRGRAMHVTVSARDAQGLEHRFTASLDALPLVERATWDTLAADDTVARRLTELRAAELQRRVRQAVIEREWGEAERMLGELDAMAGEHPWLQAAVQALRELLAQRDHRRMEKELAYTALAMGTRLAIIGESGDYSVAAESEAPAFLRRKTMQGRRSAG